MKNKLWRGLIVALMCFVVISAVAACGGRSRDPVVHISSIEVQRFDQNSNTAFLRLEGTAQNIPEGYAIVIIHHASSGDKIDEIYLSLPAFPMKHVRVPEVLTWDTWIDIMITPEMAKLGETYIGYALLESDASVILGQAVRTGIQRKGMGDSLSQSFVLSLPIERYLLERIVPPSNLHLDKVTLRTERLNQVRDLSYSEWSGNK